MKLSLPFALILTLLTLPALAQETPSKATSETTTPSPNSQLQTKAANQAKPGLSPTTTATPQQNQLRKKLRDGTSPNCRLNNASANNKGPKQNRNQRKMGRGNGVCDGSGRQGTTTSKGQCRHKGRNR